MYELLIHRFAVPLLPQEKAYVPLTSKEQTPLVDNHIAERHEETNRRDAPNGHRAEIGDMIEISG